MPTSGAFKLRSTSCANAFIGETYNTRQRRLGSAGLGSEASLSRHHRNAASVLPEPVGARIKVCSLLAMAAQPCSWAEVGAANVPANHARVAGLKRSRTFFTAGILR